MGAYKTGIKGGSFFQLFDWRKPRKKSNGAGSSSPEQPKEVNEKDDRRFPATHAVQTEEEDGDFNGVSSVTAGSTDDYSCDCASLATNEDSTESRAPGVVARLMGLDFLPTTASTEPFFQPSAETGSLRDVQHRKENEAANPITIIRSSDVYTRKLEGVKSQRIPRSPLEKFQAEVLPSRSVKSDPTTHGKSPSSMKRPVLMSQSNAAHLFQASREVHNPGGCMSSSNTGVHSARSSLPPQKLRQLPESSATSRTASRLSQLSNKPNQLNDSSSLRKSHLGTRGNYSSCTTGYQRPCKTEVNLVTVKGNRKSVSATSSSKVNVHKIESPHTRKGSLSQSENPRIQSKKQLKTVSIVQKDELQRNKPATSMPGALKQNQQYQNSLSDEDKLHLKYIVSEKSVAGGFAPIRNAISSKSTQESSLLRHTNNSSSRVSTEKSGLTEDKIVAKRKRHIKPNVIFDEKFKMGGDGRKKGIDVVSFTFTSIKKPMPVPMSKSSVKMAEEEDTAAASSADDYCKGKMTMTYEKKMMSSRVSSNAISSSTLSILLEQKLRELTLEFGSSSKETNATSGTCSSQDPLSPSPMDSFSETEGESLETGSYVQDDLPLLSKFSMSSNIVDALESTSSLQTNGLSTRCVADACKIPDQQQGNLGGLENESFCASGSCSHCYGNMKYVTGNQCDNTCNTEAEESEKQLSDLSTLSFAKNGSKDVELFSRLNHSKLHKEQDEYLRKILIQADSSLRGSVTGYASETLDLCLFELLETMISSSNLASKGNDSCRVERKLLFDCVSESLDLKRRQYFCTGYHSWIKGATKIVQGQFSIEIYKEILGWRRKEDLMVDELVEDDMGRCIGASVYFLNNAFEVGIVIADDILTCLTDELLEELIL